MAMAMRLPAISRAVTEVASAPVCLRRLFCSNASRFSFLSPQAEAETPARPQAEPSTNLFVSGLSKRTTSERLRTAFAQFGEVTDAKVVTDRVSGYSKGFGFVRYATLEDSTKGIAGMHGKEMKYVKPLRLLGNALKTKVSSVPGHFLGLDVGDKYVGLAISDPSNMVASPLSVLLRKKTNIDLMATDFQNLVKTFSVSGLVVGYPFGKLNNVEDVVTVNLFMEELRKTEKLKDVAYTYWDERLSSKTIELMLKPLNLHPVQEKTMLDKLAAVVILQEFLDYANRYVNTEPTE